MILCLMILKFCVIPLICQSCTVHVISYVSSASAAGARQMSRARDVFLVTSGEQPFGRRTNPRCSRTQCVVPNITFGETS